MFNKRKAPESPPLEPSPVRKEADPVKPQTADATRSAVTSNPRNTAMIGASIKIKGDISGEENLQIDGQVEGKVELPQHDLTVGETGIVTADLNARTIKIHGNVTGDIQGSEMVVVSKTGKVLGNIVAPRVTLEDGAQFKGSIDMSPAESSSAPPRAAPAKADPAPTGEADNTADKQASSAA